LEGVVHHSDRAVQYLAIRYTERLAEALVLSDCSETETVDRDLALGVLAHLVKCHTTPARVCVLIQHVLVEHPGSAHRRARTVLAVPAGGQRKTRA